jgi:membrane associated rhomboid family serine protease
MLRLTPVVKNLIIINAIVFFAGMFAPQVFFSNCISYPLDVISAYLSMYNYDSDCFKPYQLFTYMFVHGGFGHIFFNMLTLAFIGPILESFWGSKRFTTFYLVTGIGAAVFTVIVNVFFNVGLFGTMVGASGAIYGLLMGFGMLFPNMEVMLLIPPIPIKAKYLVFLVGGLTFLMDRSGTVAHFTHLGGIVFAFILIRLWRHQGGSYY